MSLARPCFAALALCMSLGAAAAELTISAAASLGNAFNELGPVFEAAHPGNRLHFNYGASGALLQQIAKGAPVDVFASADQETLDQAQRQGLVDAAQRRNFASNTLVVVVPARAAATATRYSAPSSATTRAYWSKPCSWTCRRSASTLTGLVRVCVKVTS